MMLHEKDDAEAEPLYRDDEESYAKDVRPQQSNRLVYILGTIGYLVLIGLYGRLWLRSRDLEAEIKTLQPELFPCMYTCL
jgi:hypothetical protein